MDLSIIIPVSQDFRLLECLKSVDVDAEIVVVFNNNPSRELIEMARKDLRVNPIIVDDDGCNLARIFNIGILKATYKYVLLTNSDCLFFPGQITACFDMLQISPVVKGHIQFRANSFMTRMVAELRFLFHEVFPKKKSLFGPGLAFHRSIVGDIGGYYFDEDMGWGEDGELSERIYASGLEIRHLPGYAMSHPSESMLHDLHVAYKIGYGEWVQHDKKGMTLTRAIFTDVRNLFHDKSRRFRTAFSHGGFLLVTYLFIWKAVAHCGYYKHAFQKLKEKDWRNIKCL